MKLPSFKAVALLLLQPPSMFFGRPKKPYVTPEEAAERLRREQEDWRGCEASIHPDLLKEFQQ